MKLKELTFASGANDAAQLQTVTVQMTVEEALWIARVAGQQRGTSPHNSIYACMSGDVFNRLWDDGIDEARGDYPFAIPPIHYDNKRPKVEKQDG